MGRVSYDTTFRGPFIDENGYAYDMQELGRTALSMPLAGTWIIQGEIRGQQVAQVRLWLDGSEVSPATLVFSSTLRAFRLTVDLPAGTHSLEVHAGEAEASLRLRNLVVWLQAPIPPRAQSPLAAFANDEGLQFELIEATVYQSISAAHSDNYVITWWRNQSGITWSAESADLPTMYVHVTDQRGQTFAQADHMLGEHAIWAASGEFFIDAVRLPDEAAVRPDAELRIGLWFPDTRTYYWPTDPSLADTANRLRLGTIHGLRLP